MICAPCLMVTVNQSDLARPADYNDWTIKRLAWAFGCARKDSDLEIDLYRALKAKIGALQT